MRPETVEERLERLEAWAVKADAAFAQIAQRFAPPTTGGGGGG
jgi:hypothetical protein